MKHPHARGTHLPGRNMYKATRTSEPRHGGDYQWKTCAVLLTNVDRTPADHRHGRDVRIEHHTTLFRNGHGGAQGSDRAHSHDETPQQGPKQGP
jgi:hypothetical protein